MSRIAGAFRPEGYADGRGREAYFNRIQGLAPHPDGTIWITDAENALVRRLAPDGTVTTIAGRWNGPRLGPVDGVGSQAEFMGLGAIAPAARGGVYVVDGETYPIQTGCRREPCVWPSRLRFVGVDGAVVTMAQPTQYLAAMATAPDGTLFVASPNEIWRSAAQGWELLPGLRVPFEAISHMVVDRNHTIYLLERSFWRGGVVRRVAPDGTVTDLAGALRESSTAPLPSRDGVGSDAVFRWPVALTLDADGNVWVLDTDPLLEVPVTRLRKVTPQGVVSTPFVTEPGRAGSALATATGGDLLVSYGYGVARLGANGTTTPLAGQDHPDPPPLGRVAAMAVDPQGRVLLVEQEALPLHLPNPAPFSVRRLARDGTTVSEAAPIVTNDPGRKFVAIGRDGVAYVTLLHVRIDGATSTYLGGSLRKYLPDGSHTVLAQWPDDGTGIAPGQVAVSRNGTVVFADLLGGNVMQVSPGGGLTVLARKVTAGAAESGFFGPWGLAIDDQDRVYVECYGRSLCRIEGGQVVRIPLVDGTGAPAKVSDISTLLGVDRAGNVLLSDLWQVLRATPGGVVSTIAGDREFQIPRMGPLPGWLGGFASRAAVADDGTLYVVVDNALVRIDLDQR